MTSTSASRLAMGARVLALSGLIAALASQALAFAPPSSSSAGASSGFDAAQVARGRAAFTANCSTCHGMDLSGGGAPPLKGSGFEARWLGSPASLTALGHELRRMPKGAPNSLPTATYADIKTYILSVNGYKPHGAHAHAQAAVAKAEPPEKLPSTPASVGTATTSTPVDAELLTPADGDWPMYNRVYSGQRFSPLAQITAANAGQLQVACILQLGELGSFQSSPIFYKGVGYVTTVYSVVAFDAATCDKKWTYTYTPKGPEGIPTNRGAALYEGMIFRGATDGHLLALDAATGTLLWDVRVADSAQGHFISAAPIVYQGKVIVGLGGGDAGAVGHIYAFDAKTGRNLWIFDPIPTGNEPGAETWKKGAASGGGATWTSFAVDVKDNLVLAPIGNPGPDFQAAARPGDNLYTDSVVALDADTGKLAWYEQQRPADYHDWDTAAPPMIYEQDGRRYLAVGSKDGHVYLYDRDSKALISKTPVTTIANTDAPFVVGQSVRVCPGYGGGVEWYGPAYSPQAKAMFVGSVDWCGDYKMAPEEAHTPGAYFMGGDFSFVPPAQSAGWIHALDAATGQSLWSYHADAPVAGGVTPTAGGVVLAGVTSGTFVVFDAKDGRILYQFHTGGAISGGVSTYLVGDRQYVAVASGSRGGLPFGLAGSPSVIVFTLRP